MTNAEEAIVRTDTGEIIPPGVAALALELLGDGTPRGAGEALVAERENTPQWAAVNRIERRMAEMPQVAGRLRHWFTPVPQAPGLMLYTREIVMPAGMLLTSRIHLFEHPFVIASGMVSVWTLESGWQTLRAPYVGITSPATRRVLYIHEETTWVTFHHSRHCDPDRVVEEVTHDHMKLGHMNELSPERLAAIQANAMSAKSLQ